MLAWFLLPAALAGTLRVHMLDVGQGDALLLVSPEGRTVLIDAGPERDGTLGQLQALGITQLSLVVATHPHADHIGGMQAVIDNLPVGLYVDSGLPHTTQGYAALMASLEARDVPYKTARAGQVYRLDDGITIRVMWPGDTYLRDTRSDLNSNSVVLRVDHGEDCFLFTGDSEEPTELALLSREVQDCDVLKVAHHGSNHSTTRAFLERVRPRFALISAGQGNRYGHPGEEAIQRLQDAGVTILRTDHSGHLTLASTGQGITVEEGMVWWVPPQTGTTPTPAPSPNTTRDGAADSSAAGAP